MKSGFFAANRVALTCALEDDVVVVGGYTALQRTNDASFTFEQEANFWWLTGIEQPDWWVIIDGEKTWLVQPKISDTHQIFDGSLSADDALKISGADEVITNEQASTLLTELAAHHDTVYAIGDSPYSDHYDFIQNPAPKKLWKKVERLFTEVTDCRRDLARLRAIKQPEEIEALQKAIDLTIVGFEKVKTELASFTHEYEIDAEFSYLFRRTGASGHAYDPIVAAGKNACTLHYVANTSKLQSAELILMDVGARVDGYAADITRTYAYGTPTARQTAVHKAVETAHKEIIALIKPGFSVDDYQLSVDEIMKKALTDLGLLNKPSDYRTYFPHAISHGLGVDVHDSLGAYKEFMPGMVLTVEPGIYIPEEGIGVRIEDDILVTEVGSKNLSAALSISL